MFTDWIEESYSAVNTTYMEDRKDIYACNRRICAFSQTSDTFVFEYLSRINYLRATRLSK